MLENFRNELLQIFISADWKSGLENTFSRLTQKENQKGVEYALQVWDLAKQINQDYKELAILTKLENSKKVSMVKNIKRRENYL